ncbi:hypothetical protein AFLA_013557 [Aspergillus flavus NRRL3357]|nr:hypothetical protein AFLA_013557 [Aspergillus flavus NRRL3357]
MGLKTNRAADMPAETEQRKSWTDSALRKWTPAYLHITLKNDIEIIINVVWTDHVGPEETGISLAHLTAVSAVTSLAAYGTRSMDMNDLLDS